MTKAEFRPLIIGLLLVGLFAIAVINGALLLSINNNSPNSIGNDPAIASYKESLEQSLEQAKTSADASEDAIGTSPITLTTGTLVFDAIGGVWKSMKEVPIMVYNLTFGLAAQKLFGDASFGIVLAIISAIVTITIIFGVWKWVTTGEGG